MAHVKQDRNEGFTTIELLTVMIILAVVTAIAAPRFSELSGSSDRFAARSHLLEDIKTAQAYTLTQGCRGIFTVDADGGGYSFGCDYLGYDPDPVPEPDSINFSRRFNGDVTMTATSQIILNSRGQTVDVSDIQQNVTIELSSTVNGSYQMFARGTLLGTGVFEYE